MQPQIPGQRNGDAPHGDEPHQQREAGIAGGPQRVDHHNIEGAPRLQDQTHQKELAGQRQDLGIIGEEPHQIVPAPQRRRDHHSRRHQQTQPQAAQQLAIGQLELARPHQMPHQYLGPQTDGEAKQQDKEADLEEERLGRQRLVAHQGHKGGHHHKLQHPGEVLPGRRQADMHDLAQHLPRPDKELAQHQTDAGTLLQQPDQHAKRHQATHYGTHRHPGDTHFGQAEPAKEQQGIADKGDDVGHQGHIHGIPGMTMGAQRRRHTQCRRLGNETDTDQGQIDVAVGHQVRRHIHQSQQAVSPYGHHQHGDGPHQQIEADGGLDHPSRHGFVTGPQILGNHHAGADADEVEEGDTQIQHLITDGQCCHRFIGDMPHHEGVEGAGEEVKGQIDKERPGQGKE